MSVQWVKIGAGNYHAKRNGETVARACYDHGKANNWALHVLDGTPMINRSGNQMDPSGYTSLAMCKSVYENRRQKWEADGHTCDRCGLLYNEGVHFYDDTCNPCARKAGIL